MVARIPSASPISEVTSLTELDDSVWILFPNRKPPKAGFYLTKDPFADPAERILYWDEENWLIPQGDHQLSIMGWRDIEGSSLDVSEANEETDRILRSGELAPVMEQEDLTRETLFSPRYRCQDRRSP